MQALKVNSERNSKYQHSMQVLSLPDPLASPL